MMLYERPAVHAAGPHACGVHMLSTSCGKKCAMLQGAAWCCEYINLFKPDTSANIPAGLTLWLKNCGGWRHTAVSE